VKRDLRVFYAYRLLATAFVFVPVEVPYLLGRGLSFTAILLLQALFSAVVIVLDVPTGALADRFGRKWALAAGSLLTGCGSLLFWQAHGLPRFVLAQALLAVGMTLISGPDSAWLYDRLAATGDDARYRGREGAATAMKHVGTALAFAAGGFLGRIDLGLPYLVTGCVSVLAAGAALLLREPPSDRRASAWRGLWPHLAQALRTSFTVARLRWAILYSALIFVLLRVSLWLYQPYLKGAGFDLAAIGLIFAGVYLIAALASNSVDAIRRRCPGVSIYWALPLVLGLSYLLLGRFTATWGVLLLLAQKAVDGVYSPLTKDLIQRDVPDSGARATVLSVESMVRRLAFCVFAPLCGLLVDRCSLSAALYGCAVVAALGAGALLGVRRSFRLEAAAQPLEQAGHARDA
jgi:MFS family permease